MLLAAPGAHPVRGASLKLPVNLLGTAWIAYRPLASRTPIAQLERWQTGYLPIFAVWLAVVVLMLPPPFAPKLEV